MAMVGVDSGSLYRHTHSLSRLAWSWRRCTSCQQAYVITPNTTSQLVSAPVHCLAWLLVETRLLFTD